MQRREIESFDERAGEGGRKAKGVPSRGLPEAAGGGVGARMLRRSGRGGVGLLLVPKIIRFGI